ncbi:hypothetical protein ATANTOWER_008832, partial [Ataeniobius toweri]|nr:hypothetical protein [Ataeniobius toweri]
MYATLCTLSSSYSSLLPFAHVEELIVILLHDSCVNIAVLDIWLEQAACRGKYRDPIRRNMSNDRAAVFRTTKVRTKLRGDGSWLQQQDEPDAETQEEEKPWLADVRARRLNGAPIDTSPVSSPVKTTPPPVKSDTDSKPSTQGYLIRGVFTKLDNPVSSPSYNGPSKPKLFTKRPSESYKKIAPHTVRSSSENPEDQLSPEEQEKRKEAAISVLKKKPSKRSYVLSAAKLYEAKDTSPETSPASSPSFVAKRVEIVDDSKSAPTPAPASTVAPFPAVLPTSAASTPAPKPQTAVNTTAKTTDESAVKEAVNPKATNPPAKLNEAKDTSLNTCPAINSPSFVAKRVEVVDDSKNVAPPAPPSTVASSPAVPPTSAASTPAPKPQTAVNTTVKTTDESTVKEPVNVKSTSPAAKLNEAKDTSPDTTLASSSPSFLAKKVEIIDDSKSAPTPAPASTVAPYPAIPPISAASTLAPKPQTVVNTTVKTTDESAIKEPANPKGTNPPAVPEKEEPLLQSNAEKEQTEDKKTNSNNTTITGSVRVATTEPQTKAETPLVKLLPSSKTSPAQKSVGSDSPALTSTVTVPPVPVPRSAPTTASPAPVTPVPALTVTELMVKTEPEPEQEPELKDEAEAEPEDEAYPELEDEPEVEHELEPSAEP